MLLVPEGVLACNKCCRVGLAVSSLATDGASHSCSVRTLFRITSIQCVAFHCAWHKITMLAKPCSLHSLCSPQYLYTPRVSPHQAIARRRCLSDADSGQALVQICFVIIAIVMRSLRTSSACPTVSHRTAAALHIWQKVEVVREAFHR